jgi:hypothetical protein
MSRGSRTSPGAVLALAAMGWAVVAAAGQTGPAFRGSLEHPAIQYSTAPLSDAVTTLNRRLETGATRLASDPDKSYLPAVLDALQVPRESQIAVFSETSFQAEMITPQNPRVIYFNDSVAVGWVRGGSIEVAAQDPQLGPIFYELDARASQPRFERSTECLVCHRTWDTLAVPGLLVLTTFPPLTKNAYANGGVTDHRSPFEHRWAGWYVTGRTGRIRHMGNKPLPTMTDTSPTVTLDSLAGKFDLKGYLTPFSDVVALMVFEHQARMTNLLTYMTWEARAATLDPQALGGLDDIARDVVDYMLFVDEAPFAGPIEGSSGFAEMFAAKGPRDARGRSLRQLSLERRLMRYPCSYMIYAPAFEALPRPAKEAVYRRLWQVLSGEETAPAYSRLSLADRQAVVEILRDTKKDLPGYFQAVRK